MKLLLNENFVFEKHTCYDTGDSAEKAVRSFPAKSSETAKLAKAKEKFILISNKIAKSKVM